MPALVREGSKVAPQKATKLLNAAKGREKNSDVLNAIATALNDVGGEHAD